MCVAVFFAFVAIVVISSLFFIVHSLFTFFLLTILAWFALPGVVLAWRMYRHERARTIAALLAGPAWGYVFSSLVLLAFWIAGVRSFMWLMTAPIPSATIAWLAGTLAPSLSV